MFRFSVLVFWQLLADSWRRSLYAADPVVEVEIKKNENEE